MVDSFPVLLMILICCDLGLRTFATAEGDDRYINVQCYGNGIAIFLTKKLLPRFNHSSFHLNNNSCTGHQLNHSHIILETGLSECGTIKRRGFNGSYVHANLVHGYLKNPRNCSSKNITTRFAVECKEPSEPALENKTSLESDLNLSNNGSEEVYAKDELKLYKMPLLAHHEAKSTQPRHSAFQAVETNIVKNGEEVSFTTQISTKGKQYGFGQRFIAVKDCRATPDDNFDSNEGVTLIENGCVRKPDLCSYMFKSRSLSQTISYRVSGSNNQKSSALFVHCRFVLCSKVEQMSLCRIGCGGVGRILKSDKNITVMLHVGPLTSNLEKAQVNTGPRGLLVTRVAGGGAVFVLLIAVGIFIFYCKRRRRLKRRDTLLDNEEELSDNERGFDQVDDTAVFEESSESLQPQLSDETDSCSILERRKLFLNMDWTTV